MFCSNCGKELNEGDKFCSNCGNQVIVTVENDLYDVKSIVDQFGKNRIAACKYLSNTYNLPLKKAKELIDKEHERRIENQTILEVAKNQIAEKTLKSQKELQKINQLKEEKIPFCPKCHSTNLTAQKKGFGLLKGALGVATVGLYGATAAGIGKNKIILTCLNCGYQFKPGK